MINWKKCTYGDKVRLIDIDDAVFDGIVESFNDIMDCSDLEPQEDGITIITNDGQHIGFYESEIKSVSRRYDDGEIIDVRIIPHVDTLQQSS
jgi:hypothetical protein